MKKAHFQDENQVFLQFFCTFLMPFLLYFGNHQDLFLLLKQNSKHHYFHEKHSFLLLFFIYAKKKGLVLKTRPNSADGGTRTRTPLGTRS